jgi:hypothetical protein
LGTEHQYESRKIRNDNSIFYLPISEYEGNWYRDKKVGVGSLKFPNGTRLFGKWTDGILYGIVHKYITNHKHNYFRCNYFKDVEKNCFAEKQLMAQIKPFLAND